MIGTKIKIAVATVLAVATVAGNAAFAACGIRDTEEYAVNE